MGLKGIPSPVAIELPPNGILRWRNRCSHVQICIWSPKQLGHWSGFTMTKNGTTVACGLIFILLFKFCTCTGWGSLISKGRLPDSGSTGGLWIKHIGKWNNCPFRTSFVFAIFSLIRFCSKVGTADDRWPPRATTSNSCSSSSSSSTNSFISCSSSSSGFFLF